MNLKGNSYSGSRYCIQIGEVLHPGSTYPQSHLLEYLLPTPIEGQQVCVNSTFTLDLPLFVYTWKKNRNFVLQWCALKLIRNLPVHCNLTFGAIFNDMKHPRALWYLVMGCKCSSLIENHTQSWSQATPLSSNQLDGPVRFSGDNSTSRGIFNGVEHPSGNC